MFRSLFKKDWSAELDRAEALIESGDPVQALEIATRARRKAEALAPRAAKVTAVAKDAVRDLALANANAAEAKGDLEDAADWLEAAAQHSANDARAELELRIRQLHARVDGLVGGARITDENEEVVVATTVGLDLASHYEMLVDTVAEPLREHYVDRPSEFQQALVDLSEGRWQAALDALGPLAVTAPDDPIVRLEVGRARNFLEDLDGALVDFDVAWRELGDQSLDAADSSSAPALWAETALEAGRAEEVVERLRESAAIEGDGRVDVCAAYANAMVATERHDEAVAYLERAVQRIPDVTRFKYMLGWALEGAGREDDAIARFEEIVEAGCRVGCSRDRIHLPAFWSLVRLYSDRGQQLERARELLVIATNTQGGHLSARNYETLAVYFSATGDRSSAEHAVAEARRLHAIGESATSRTESMLG